MGDGFRVVVSVTWQLQSGTKIGSRAWYNVNQSDYVCNSPVSCTMFTADDGYGAVRTRF